MMEKFKLRKVKIGLFSVAITVLYVFIQHEAEASKKTETEVLKNTNQSVLKESSQNEQLKANKDISQTNSISSNQNQINNENKHQKNVESNKNFVTLDPIKPGDQKVTGKTLPNNLILLNIDKKSVDSVDNESIEFVTSKDDGKFEYDLKGYKIVHNQEIEVTSSPSDFSEEIEEDTESNDAQVTFTTPRYEKAYKIPENQLSKVGNHHQVLIEPITEGSNIIKGHTSVKGKVALSINNKFINLGVDDHLTEEQGESMVNGIWKFIDRKGYFEFDFKRKPYENLNLKEGDIVSLVFAPDNDEDALKPTIFKTKVVKFDNIDKAETKYDYNKVFKVHVLENNNDDLHIDNIYADIYQSEKGIDVLQQAGTKVIQGKTKFANGVIKVYSSLGEGQVIPDLQVDHLGHFSFDLHYANHRLFNGEELMFVVVDPITGAILSKEYINKKVEIYETPEQKADREFSERLERTPAYHKLFDDKIVGFNINGDPITWFLPLGEKKIERKKVHLEK
ncbi:hypothetical protein JGT54_11410 [Staphylococcus aureus]|uniref:hypothetical protein n=1 Tax=Staphylococcus aureus TaxID=1280 RepID=UPI0018EA1F2A|nr:hypothetical protein [Staphylococcus aureus]MBJ6131158.1 hypothetical protein [Staphylococcus aureus]MBJ6141734.1 hypothetical protein [Staphylococcus aureus]MBJ6156496.1 hypothetical protein [Staphylococcus aureus]MBJ6159061.1 hypothetical protein [Staphylococcus aureus]MBJ6161739.1 hypothetical protein [Staphylococcus aureus]